jgi:hypothetical protein
LYSRHNRLLESLTRLDSLVFIFLQHFVELLGINYSSCWMTWDKIFIIFLNHRLGIYLPVIHNSCSESFTSSIPSRVKNEIVLFVWYCFFTTYFTLTPFNSSNCIPWRLFFVYFPHHCFWLFKHLHFIASLKILNCLLG